MNPDQPAEDNHQPGFDPHGEDLTGRDVSFLLYMAGLAVIPLIMLTIMIWLLIANNPDFDNFPKGKPSELPRFSTPAANSSSN